MRTSRCPQMSIMCIRLACQMCVSSQILLPDPRRVVSRRAGKAEENERTLPAKEQVSLGLALHFAFAPQHHARLLLGFCCILGNLLLQHEFCASDVPRGGLKRTSESALARRRVGSRRML